MTRIPDRTEGSRPGAMPGGKSSARPDEAASRSGRGERPDMQVLGEFMVFFDGCTDRSGRSDWFVRIYDAASGEETLLAPPARDRWAEWIMARVKLPAAVRLTFRAAATEETGTGMSPPVKRRAAHAPRQPGIEVLHIRFTETEPDRAPLAEIRFRLSGTLAESLTRQRVPYRIEIYALDLDGRRPALLAAKEGHLEPQVFVYTESQTFTLPAVGRYQLHSRVLLLPPVDRLASHRGPVLNVVP